MDTSICTGLAVILQNVQDVEGGGGGQFPKRFFYKKKKKELKTTKHCSGGERVNYSRIFTF